MRTSSVCTQRMRGMSRVCLRCVARFRRPRHVHYERLDPDVGVGRDEWLKKIEAGHLRRLARGRRLLCKNTPDGIAAFLDRIGGLNKRSHLTAFMLSTTAYCEPTASLGLPTRTLPTLSRALMHYCTHATHSCHHSRAYSRKLHSLSY